MQPVHFGTADRRLAGTYHPAGGGYSQKAFLLCNPLGQEAIRVFRFYRELAQKLSHSGAHVFRFDYFGCGDSLGEAADCSVSGCLQDIEFAARELLDTAAVDRLSLIGARLGASFAWLALPKLARVDRTILLDPVIDGRAWIDAARSAHEIMLSDPQRFPIPRAREEAAGELLGFEMPEELLVGLAALELRTDSAPRAGRLDIVATGNHHDYEPFVTRLRAAEADCRVSAMSYDARWDDGTALENTLIAPDLVTAIVERALQ